MALRALFDKPRRTPAQCLLAKAKREAGEEDFSRRFELQIRAHRLPEPTRELRFASAEGRGWRFDFAWEPYRVAVELEGLVAVRMRDGSVFAGGRHATFEGFRRDTEKYAVAAILGWYVLRFEQQMVKAGEAIALTERMLKSKGWR